MNSHEALGVVTAWILEKHPDRSEIPLDADLLTERIVDSLAFVDLIELLSELTQQDIDVSTMDVETFQTLTAIRTNFLSVLDA